jgi:D-3-phosphoglycerate dehydrogenase / 2-oxoglutarate reductase
VKPRFWSAGFSGQTASRKFPTMPKVLITPASLAGIDGAYVKVLRDAGFELAYPPIARQLTEDEIFKQLSGVCATLAGSEPYTPRVFAAHPQLKVIARLGVGYDAVDTAAASKQGVVVTIAPGTNQDSVAEHAFTLFLALAKHLIPQHFGTKTGKWPRQTNLPLRGRTLGIAGLGRIGKAVAIRGACFGMKMLAYEPFPDHQFLSQYKIPLVSLERLFSESDYVSIHVPLTPESKYLVNKKTLAMMKPTAFLINTARGGLVCEADLIEALKAKRIQGAALDVFEQEPPPMSELFQLDNVVFTPHAAGVDLQSRDDMAESAARAIVDLSRGQWPSEKVVNPEAREKFKW